MAWFIGLENQQVCYWHEADIDADAENFRSKG